MDKESPLKNIKKGILNTKIEDVDFDNFYMDSRNLNCLVKLSESTKLLKDLKKNELLNNLQTTLNGKNSNVLSGSINKRNRNVGSHLRSYSYNNPISFRVKRNDDEPSENSYFENNFKSTSSIKNDLSKITNILNITNFNKSFVKKNSINSKEDFSESIRKRNNENNNNNNLNNSLKNSSGKTFYSTLCKTPNSNINGNNNNNECIISNYSHESISPERKNLSNQNKFCFYRTAANFFNYKNSTVKHQDSLEIKSNMNDNNVINPHKANENIYRKESKSNLSVEKFNKIYCVEKLTEKIKFGNIESPVRKRDRYSMDISSNNISNINSSRNLNFVSKNESSNFKSKNNDFSKNPENLTNLNKHKADETKMSSLDLLSADNPAYGLPAKKDSKLTVKNKLFTKIDSIFTSKNSLFKAKDIGISNIFSEKYINKGKSNAVLNNNNNTYRYNLSNFSKIRNELNRSSNYRDIDNSNRGIVFAANLNSKNKVREPCTKKLTFQLFKNEPCKYNKFNNFNHLREEMNSAQFDFFMNKNNLFNKSSANYKTVATGTNNDIELTFSKNANSFINRTNIVNKIEATKRLKLK